MTALEKITPMFLANAAFCIENGSDVKPETRESIIDTLIKASEELSQANAEMIAVTTRTQGADDQFIAEHGHRLAELLRLDYLDIADRDAQISMLLANKSPRPVAADDAQPVAIYQVIAGYGVGVYRDCSQEEYVRAGENNPFRRIVYATRATPADHISQARDAWVEIGERLPEAHEWVLVSDGTWSAIGMHLDDEDLEPNKRWMDESAELIETNGIGITHWQPLPAPPEKPAGDVSDI